MYSGFAAARRDKDFASSVCLRLWERDKRDVQNFMNLTCEHPTDFIAVPMSLPENNKKYVLS